MKWFRRSFLNKLYEDISTYNASYCCNVKTWHLAFSCFKDLKEVQANMNSKYLMEVEYNYDCKESWFDSRHNRLNFLKECIHKLDK